MPSVGTQENTQTAILGNIDTQKASEWGKHNVSAKLKHQKQLLKIVAELNNRTSGLIHANTVPSIQNAETYQQFKNVIYKDGDPYNLNSKIDELDKLIDDKFDGSPVSFTKLTTSSEANASTLLPKTIYLGSGRPPSRPDPQVQKHRLHYSNAKYYDKALRTDSFGETVLTVNPADKSDSKILITSKFAKHLIYISHAINQVKRSSVPANRSAIAVFFDDFSDIDEDEKFGLVASFNKNIKTAAAALLNIHKKQSSNCFDEANDPDIQRLNRALLNLSKMVKRGQEFKDLCYFHLRPVYSHNNELATQVADEITSTVEKVGQKFEQQISFSEENTGEAKNGVFKRFLDFAFNEELI